LFRIQLGFSFAAMSPRGSQQRSTMHKVWDGVSPDDVAARLNEARAREQQDTRTPAQVWLNEPPPGRSALAQRASSQKTSP